MLIDRGPAHGLLFSALVEEHRTMRKMYAELLSYPETDPEGRAQAFRRLARLLRAHARAEEEIVFPVLDDSHELGHHVRTDAIVHAEIGAMLERIETLSPLSAGWDASVKALGDLFNSHFDDEEKVLFPRAHCVISDSREADLLDEYEADRNLSMR